MLLCVVALFSFLLNVMAYCLLNLNGKGILAEGDICASQRRASSESLGYLARFGNDIFTARMACSFNLVFKIHVLLLCLVVFNYKKPSLPYTGSILCEDFRNEN